MAILFKKIPGLKLRGHHLPNIVEKVSIDKVDAGNIAFDLSENPKIPASFRELLEKAAVIADQIDDFKNGFFLGSEKLEEIVKSGTHFGRCSISPLTNPGECTHEVLITVIISGKSEVLLLNV